MVLIPIAMLAICMAGVPLFAVMATSSLLSYWRAGITFQSVMIEFYGLGSLPLLQTLPLFTFAGCLLAHSRAPERLLRLSNSILGWIPGGLCFVTVAACALLTAFTGASGITIFALGGLLLPAMVASRYNERFGVGLITASGCLGLLFPPSLPAILYGVVSGVSIDLLFRAGLLPGILTLLALAGYAAVGAYRQGVPAQAFSLRELRDALWVARYELPLPVLVIGGIYTGVFAISEAAVVGAAYALLAEMLLNRDVRPRQFAAVARESVVLSGGILIILGMTMALTNYLVTEDVPGQIFVLAEKYMSGRVAFLLTLNVFLLVVGSVLEIYAATVLVMPLLLPIAAQFNVHPIHLGVIFLTNLAIGYIMPPVGLNLFISAMRFNKPVLHVARASIPFAIVLLIVLAVITFVPWLSLVFVPQ
ncbi:MAG: C4-dicarboxylate ABC transporter [Lentisphaerae bacterium RIFOXYB12_FULL_65_16]|nr:MAG: C4-dicarboxylate ABC transporter [Lentisphaerae bacterium RIFOXYB12_FULL_65_16]OGV95266.1 MAG: C4-dicarboxylate ABC transporter [Lentisphaerae bacterium RIFOXYB12_FULL_65_16]